MHREGDHLSSCAHELVQPLQLRPHVRVEEELPILSASGKLFAAASCYEGAVKIKNGDAAALALLAGLCAFTISGDGATDSATSR